MFGCKAKYYLKKGYFAEIPQATNKQAWLYSVKLLKQAAEKQNTTSNKQTSKHVQRESTKHTSKNVLLKSKTPLGGRNIQICMRMILLAAVKQSTI